MGACLIVEDTEDHRDIFGQEGHAVFYWKTPQEIISHACALKGDSILGRDIAMNAHKIILNSRNRYIDRLGTIVAFSSMNN
jgi:hypothetical protein